MNNEQAEKHAQSIHDVIVTNMPLGKITKMVLDADFMHFEINAELVGNEGAYSCMIHGDEGQLYKGNWEGVMKFMSAHNGIRTP